MPLSKFVLLMMLSVFVASCSSVESTLISENDDGKIKKTKFDGVPIIINVPQKLGFVVTEKKYEIIPINNSRIKSEFVFERSIDKTPIPLGESKLFTLDTKRPLYGTANGMIELDAEKKYPTKITNVVDDKTLGRIIDGAGNILGGKPKTKGLSLPSTSGGIKTANRAFIKQFVSEKQYILIYDLKTQTFDKERHPIQFK